MSIESLSLLVGTILNSYRASSNLEIIMQYLYLYRDSSKANQSSDQIRIYSTHLCPRSDSFLSKKIHSPKSRISPFLLSLSLQARNNIGLSRNRKIFSPLPSFRIDREALCRPVDSSPFSGNDYPCPPRSIDNPPFSFASLSTYG